MKIRFSPELLKELKRIKKKDSQLFKRIQKQLSLLEKEPLHPSLRLHKLKGSLSKLWSISVTRSVRMVYILREKNEAYLVDIGTHDELYRTS